MAKRRQNKLPLVKKHGRMLAALATAEPKWRNRIIKEAPTELIHCISECCQNVLKGNVTLTPGQKRQLSPKCTHLRALASKSVSVKKKKQILNQKGEALLGLLLKPLVGAVLSGILK